LVMRLLVVLEDGLQKIKIKDDTKTISSVNAHHATVHQGAIKAIELWNSQEYHKAIEAMKKVENSSEVGFEELYASFVKHRL